MDIADEMMRFTRTVVLRALLGGDLGPFASRIDQAWVVINEHVGNSFWSLGIAERFQRAKARQFDEARHRPPAGGDYVINERRRNPTDSADLLSMLMGARDEETGEGMTDEQLRVEVTTFLLAGQETTSLALTWTWFLLSQHPAARQRLEHELDTVLGGPRRRNTPTSRQLPYTRMVVDEAMRLYPPAWGFSRQALDDDTLGGFQLPRGWLAFVIPYVLHRLPAYWKDPESFDPERFSPERSADRPKFVYLPFGAGPRQCIGNQFALIEAQLSVATLAQRYRLQLVPGHRVEPWPLITLRPRYGMPMIIETRQVKGSSKGKARCRQVSPGPAKACPYLMRLLTFAAFTARSTDRRVDRRDVRLADRVPPLESLVGIERQRLLDLGQAAARGDAGGDALRDVLQILQRLHRVLLRARQRVAGERVLVSRAR